MACSNPNLVLFKNDFGVVSSSFIGSAKALDIRKLPLHYSDLFTHGYYYNVVPCGKCPGCRMDYSRVWANRMLVELNDMENTAVFLTLTYNSDNLPYTEPDDNGRRYPTLSKRDLQLFWKRLRKAFPGKRIRYYIAGEYGPKTHRPHYHAIVYGLSLSDFPDLEFLRLNGLGQSYYNSPSLAKIWSNGFIVLSEVSWHTCAYVSRYVLKKRGKLDKYVVATNVEPEFNLSSRKPGIGLLNAVDMLESGLSEFVFDGNDGVYKFALSRSFYRSAENVLARASDVDDDLPHEWIDWTSPVNKRYLDFKQFVSELHIQRTDASADKLLGKLSLTSKSFEDFLKDDARKLDRSLAVFDDRMEGE